MKNLITLLVLFTILASCGGGGGGITPAPATTTTPNVSGQWTTADGGGGGFTNFDSFKNFHYSFEIVGNNKQLDIDLESSDINLNYMIFTPLGDELFKRGSSKRAFSEYIEQLSAGTYRLVVTADRRAVGRFTLKTTGTKSGLTRIASQILKSNTQTWGPLGGGGRDVTFKNHFYTFEVTDDNTSIDTELESADTDVYLMLYNNLGEEMLTSSFSNSRYQFAIVGAKKGFYRVMAATRTRSNVGNYRLNITGKIRDLTKIDSQANTVTSRWANTDAVDTYSLRISSTGNSPLDLELSSGDVNVSLELQTGTGNFITRQIADRTEFIVSKDLAPGTYRIQVKPYLKQNIGNYTLTVHGQFADFKKL